MSPRLFSWSCAQVDLRSFALRLQGRLRQVYLRGHTFRALIGPGIFYSTHAARTHASAAAGMTMDQRTGMNEPACMRAAAAASCCCWLLLVLLLACCWLLLAAAQQQQQQQQHACWFMDAGSFMHACQLLLMRACVRRAYCKKCRVQLVP